MVGGALVSCSTDPLTGFYRDGCCATGAEDVGSHTVCSVVTSEFLEFSLLAGNDLSTPRPEWGFPGLSPGDRWCVCAERWLEAHRAGCACARRLGRDARSGAGSDSDRDPHRQRVSSRPRVDEPRPTLTEELSASIEEMLEQPARPPHARGHVALRCPPVALRRPSRPCARPGGVRGYGGTRGLVGCKGRSWLTPSGSWVPAARRGLVEEGDELARCSASVVGVLGVAVD